LNGYYPGGVQNILSFGGFKVENTLKGILYSIPSSSPLVKIQIMGGKFACDVKAKHC
jgi:hypothetical protein